MYLFLNICLNVLIVISSKDDSKRLLLTDPDVILNRLTRLENLVEQLQNDNRKLTQENQQQTLTMKAMETSFADVQKQQSEYYYWLV